MTNGSGPFHTTQPTLNASRKAPAQYPSEFLDDMRVIGDVADAMAKEERPPEEIDNLKSVSHWATQILSAGGDGRYSNPNKYKLDCIFANHTVGVCLSEWKKLLDDWYVPLSLREELRERFKVEESETMEILKQNRAEVLARIGSEVEK